MKKLFSSRQPLWPILLGLLALCLVWGAQFMPWFGWRLQYSSGNRPRSGEYSYVRSGLHWPVLQNPWPKDWYEDYYDYRTEFWLKSLQGKKSLDLGIGVHLTLFLVSVGLWLSTLFYTLRLDRLYMSVWFACLVLILLGLSFVPVLVYRFVSRIAVDGIIRPTWVNEIVLIGTLSRFYVEGPIVLIVGTTLALVAFGWGRRNREATVTI